MNGAICVRLYFKHPSSIIGFFMAMPCTSNKKMLQSELNFGNLRFQIQTDRLARYSEATSWMPFFLIVAFFLFIGGLAIILFNTRGWSSINSIETFIFAINSLEEFIDGIHGFKSCFLGKYGLYASIISGQLYHGCFRPLSFLEYI